ILYFRAMNPPLSNEQLAATAAAFGTPVYVYHAEKITEQFEKLTNAFRGHTTKFFYACKALSNIHILKHIHSIGGNLDCVSIHEVKLGLKAGFEPGQILFTPNCVDIHEIIEATQLGV